MLEQGEILTLEDDKDYVVVATTILDDINYVYLMDSSDGNNFMFCAYDKVDGLFEIEDEDLLQQLLLIFNKQLNEMEK